MAEAVADLLDHAGLLRPFLASRVRSRYDAVPPRSARRAELLNKLCHGYADVLDWRYARPASAVSPADVLRGLGAAPTCYCLCGPSALDGRVVPLADALAALAWHHSAVLLVCRVGSLAFFQPEYVVGARDRFVVQRPQADPL